MKKISKSLVALMILLTFVVAGCGSKNLAAEVNGTKITKAEFTKRLEAQKKALEAQGISFTGEQGKQMEPMLEEQVINDMINETIMIQEAQKKGLKLDEQKAQAEIDNFKKTYGEEQFNALLKQQNQTVEELKKLIAVQILSNEYYELLTKNITVSEQEAKDYFEKNKNDLIEVKVRHIIKEVPEGAKPEQDQKAKAEITKIIGDLEKGANFAELAKKVSDEPAAKQSGGELNGFIRKKDGMYDPAFVDAAIKIAKGSFNKEPIKTSFGYHVILVEDKKDSFEALKKDLEKELLGEKKNKAFQAEFKQALDKAKIKNYITKKKAAK